VRNAGAWWGVWKNWIFTQQMLQQNGAFTAKTMGLHGFQWRFEWEIMEDVRKSWWRHV